jgi:hypothetical protein
MISTAEPVPGEGDEGLRQAAVAPVEDMVVRENGEIDVRSSNTGCSAGIHPVVDSLAGPVLVIIGNARFQVDDS